MNSVVLPKPAGAEMSVNLPGMGSVVLFDDGGDFDTLDQPLPVCLVRGEAIDDVVGVAMGGAVAQGIADRPQRAAALPGGRQRLRWPGVGIPGERQI